MESTIVIERCPDYNPESVKTALKKSLEPWGGMSAFVKPGQTVLLKPNLLTRADPDQAITTHPAIVRAVSNAAREAGGKVLIGDSPGTAIPHSSASLKKLYRACGIETVAKETGAQLILDSAHKLVPFPDGLGVKGMEVIQAALEADVIINLPKFKTHGFTRLTGAVKNLFGLVPGLLKPVYHARLEEVGRFSSMLVDIVVHFPPTLNIVDGIVAMEGPGPSSGTPRKVGIMIAGVNPHGIDYLLAEIMGIDPFSVQTLADAQARGLLPPENQLNILGASLEDVRQKDMEVPDTREMAFPPFLTFLYPIARRFFSTKPKITKACRGCGRCVEVCPVEAIVLKNNRARIDYSKCIRCYCCHETCSDFHAIRLATPILKRLLA